MALPVAVIDSLAFGGSGVCRIDGKVCFVPFSCPGDEVSLRITSAKKSYSLAAIAEVISPSPLRAEPLCPVFGRCGGCSWQHIGYPAQVEQKRGILADALRKGARVQGEKIDPVVAAVNPYGYRSRLQFKVACRGTVLDIGFYRHSSHQVVDAAAGCPVALPTINRVLDRFRKVLRGYPALSTVTQISIDAGECGVIVVIHQTGKISARNRDYFTSRKDDFGDCTGLFLTADERRSPEMVWGSPEISYTMHRAGSGRQAVRLTFPPGGFAQVHQRQNSAMLDSIRMLAAFLPSDRVLDLYCGNGNFSIPLADEVASMMGIEGNAASIEAANYNKVFNSVANIHFICDDVASAVRHLVEQEAVFDTILLDPPRAGAGDAVTGIAQLNPTRIIYVSCDPGTLARDCGLLAEHGYQVIRSVPVDMFPHTYHIESVTLLMRSCRAGLFPEMFRS